MVEGETYSTEEMKALNFGTWRRVSSAVSSAKSSSESWPRKSCGRTKNGQRGEDEAICVAEGVEPQVIVHHLVHSIGTERKGARREGE